MCRVEGGAARAGVGTHAGRPVSVAAPPLRGTARPHPAPMHGCARAVASLTAIARGVTAPPFSATRALSTHLLFLRVGCDGGRSRRGRRRRRKAARTGQRRGTAPGLTCHVYAGLLAAHLGQQHSKGRRKERWGTHRHEKRARRPCFVFCLYASSRLALTQSFLHRRNCPQFTRTHALVRMLPPPMLA